MRGANSFPQSSQRVDTHSECGIPLLNQSTLFDALRHGAKWKGGSGRTRAAHRAHRSGRISRELPSGPATHRISRECGRSHQYYMA